MKNRLYLFIEGEWDKMFFETFLDKELRDRFDFDEITYIEFSEDKKSREQLKKLVGGEKVNFLLCPDLDSKFDKDKKEKKIKKLINEEFNIEKEEHKKTVLDQSFVIVQMIESWYLAGFDEAFCKKMNLKFYPNTEDTNKSTFGQIAKQMNKTPLRFRDQLIKTYKSSFLIEEAKQRNESFRKFFEKVRRQTKRLS